jgi:hypothetical protein
MIKFKFTDVEIDEPKKWFSFYPSWKKGYGFQLEYEKNGYFDPRPQINTSLTTLVLLVLPFISLWLIPISLILCFYSWGSLYIKLPYDTGRGNTSESETYGLLFYHVDSGFPTEFWVRGFNKLSFNFPWAYTFDRLEVLFKDGWRKEERGDDFWDKDKWGDQILYETHDYKYELNSGEIQSVKATIYETKRYWKRWFGLHTKNRHQIEIEFDSEVGERTGSWKGGVIGCGYTLKSNETALECLRRMEKERKFK